eukprot:6203429-Pleurochrysis_carterae.AAC.2
MKALLAVRQAVSPMQMTVWKESRGEASPADLSAAIPIERACGCSRAIASIKKSISTKAEATGGEAYVRQSRASCQRVSGCAAPLCPQDDAVTANELAQLRHQLLL